MGLKWSDLHDDELGETLRVGVAFLAILDLVGKLPLQVWRRGLMIYAQVDDSPLTLTKTREGYQAFADFIGVLQAQAEQVARQQPIQESKLLDLNATATDCPEEER